MAILPGCKPDNFKPDNSPKLSFTDIWHLCSSFVECKSFLELNSPDILILCETNLDDSIDFGNFSVRGYLPLIGKDSITHIHGLAGYEKDELPFAWDFNWLSVLLLFLLLITFFVVMHGFWFYFI